MLSMFFVLPASAAETPDFTPTPISSQGNLRSDCANYPFEKNEEDEASTYSDAAYRFRHEYIIIQTAYGSWRNGVSGGTDVGPSTLTLSQSEAVEESLDLSFTTSVSGEYLNGSSIEASLGVTLGETKSYAIESSFSVPVPQYKRYLIQYRPTYYVYKVIETVYKQEYVIGFGFVETDLFTHTCYVDKFEHWDYTAIDITNSSVLL